MIKSDFKRRRRTGFTLLEVALAVIAGSVLLSSMIYATGAMRNAVVGVYNETVLQTLLRDMSGTLDSKMAPNLSTLSSQPVGTEVQLAMSNVQNEELTMQLGSGLWVRNRRAATGQTGQRFEWSTDGVNFQSAIGVGSRGMIDKAMMGYAQFEVAQDATPPAGALIFKIDDRVRGELVRLTARLAKDDMVPYYAQDVWAPRALKWSWSANSVPTSAPGPDTDGDGVNDATDHFPWDPARTVKYLNGGLYPIALDQSILLGATPGTVLEDIFNGGGSGNFGWLSWDGTGNASYLADILNNPGAAIFTNPNNPNDHTVSIGDWIWGNSGVSNSGEVGDELDELITATPREVVVMVWDKAQGTGSNAKYHNAGFAKVSLTDFDLASKQISARFLGFSDIDGNLLADVVTAPPAPIATPGGGATPTPAPTATPTPTPTPSAAASAVATATPTATPSAAASAVATATPTATPSAAASAAATPTPSPSPSPTPTPAIDVMPIGLHMNTVASIAPSAAGTSIGFKSAGTGTANFAWLTWTGNTSDDLLGASLGNPGNANTYTNPLTPSDHHLDVGDTIVGFTDINNGSANRNALDALAGRNLVIPLFNNLVISGFAKVRVTGYSLGNPNQLEFRYYGPVNSNGEAL